MKRTITRRTFCKQCNGLGWIYTTPEKYCDKTAKCPTCEGVGTEPGSMHYERELKRHLYYQQLGK